LLTSIVYRRRNRLGEPARGVAAEHFLDGQDARQTLVPSFDRGMRVARAAKRGDALKTVFASRRQFIENEHIIPQPEPLNSSRTRAA